MVGKEFNNGEIEGLFAATPPLEAKRVLFSQWSTEQTRKGKLPKLSFVDIRKAYFNGRPTRSLYIRLPPELGLPKDVAGKLVRCCYGTRDAGQIWEDCYVGALVDLGFVQGRASPCSFYHSKWQISVVVHGDDFTALGTDENLDLYEKGLARHFEFKIKGRLGLDAKDDK
jgi:hypothetical protein